MKNFSNPLENVRVASPCSQDWNQMLGDDRKRFCGECKLNVYNLSGMTRTEAESLLINSEGRLCVRFYRRADGSVLTQDCPVGWQAFKRRVSRTATAFASLMFGIVSGLGLMSLFEKTTTEPVVMGAIAYQPRPVPTPEEENLPAIMGGIGEIEENEKWTVGMRVPEKLPAKPSPKKR